MFMFKDIKSPEGKLNLFDCCENLHIHIDAALFEQLKQAIANPKQSRKLPGGFQIDLQNDRHINVVFDEANRPVDAALTIKSFR